MEQAATALQYSRGNTGPPTDCTIPLRPNSLLTGCSKPDNSEKSMLGTPQLSRGQSGLKNTNTLDGLIEPSRPSLSGDNPSLLSGTDGGF